MKPTRIPAVLMRGGTSKGVFFRGGVLPADPATRDAVLLRVLGSPDPYGRQMDGLGGATSSTSKAVIVSRSERPGYDVDYNFAAIDIGKAVVDWSGSCGNLVTAVGPFAIAEGLVAPTEGETVVRIWQVNTEKEIIARVPVRDGLPLEEGELSIDGVPFPGAEIRLEFPDPGGAGSGRLLPTGNVTDLIQVPGLGAVEATLVDAGNPTVFIRAETLGLNGTELAPRVDGDAELSARLEAIRARAAVMMGLAASPEEATARRPATPKVSFVAPPAGYTATSGEAVTAGEIDCLARILSMGRLHHAYTGTGSVAAAVAAELPGSVVNSVARHGRGGLLRLGHPAGTLEVGAQVSQRDGQWHADHAFMRRTARRLMEGSVLVPAGVWAGG